MAEGHQSFLRRFLPASSVELDHRVADVLEALQQHRRDVATVLERVDHVGRESAAAVSGLELQLDEARSSIESLNQIVARLQVLEEESTGRHDRVLGEILWAEVYKSTISASEWFVNRSLSPGRWAVGYPYLYLLYRILDEVRPVRILELGLGQSTRMIAQYASSASGIEHLVVEHDQAWVDFFSRGFTLPASTTLLKTEWDYAAYKGEQVRTYARLDSLLEDRRFDLVSIDGPLGGDMRPYARIDVLRLLPGCLAASFAVLMDDFEREGEAHTVQEMRSVLGAAGVAYRHARYSGNKDVGLLCSPDLGFLCSM